MLKKKKTEKGVAKQLSNIKTEDATTVINAHKAVHSSFNRVNAPRPLLPIATAGPNSLARHEDERGSDRNLPRTGKLSNFF
ncbi:hypothetical protein [Novipirellula galeiformis]|uniref:hypothetical protein n=1 Tax=Novipirellula galeiformis TaxID=2528004 RepID=UPI0011B7A27C|nr:hypothetical protein [Novipirellula galeiformis]